MTEQTVLTADRPTGHLHLGHYIGSLKKRVELQDEYKCFIMVADIQALSDNFDDPEKVRSNVVEICKDYLAVGLDPQKSTLFIQSLIPELFELTSYFLNLVSVSRLERNPTVKSELTQKNFSESVTAGFLTYPVSQASDIAAFKADLIPVGEDQLPHLELTNEVIRRFNRIYKSDVFHECRAILGKVGRLVGTDGKAKASKSLNNAIFLSDSAEIIKQKVYSMYTDPDHIKVSDPGKVEGNVVFAYLDAFYDAKEELDSLKDQYRKGGLGDTVIKSLLNDVLQKQLQPVREKRTSLSDGDVMAILLEGSKIAREVAEKTLQEVRETIGIVYRK